MLTTSSDWCTWRFLHDADGEVHFGPATDARGLRLRAESGYTYVDMGTGWWQIGMAEYRLAWLLEVPQ